ncbi:unnamed protein product [Heterobilharzia americana]|nr:unnamed protein product [Heterobilharzia americana]
MDRDYSPLSSTCVKNLVDKLFEKRKLASLEVERVIKDCISQTSTPKYPGLLDILVRILFSLLILILVKVVCLVWLLQPLDLMSMRVFSMDQ